MASSSKMIILESSDRETFEVAEEVAKKSKMVNDLIDNHVNHDRIRLPNVTAKILSKVLEYCKKHVTADENTAEELRAWDDDFVKIDQNTLYDLMQAANYLHIQNLFDLTCQTVANMIKGKTAEEIRMTFNIKNDFTPEEQEQIEKESSWAFM